MKLYGFPPSPNTWKVRAVAAHLGIPLEFEFVDLMQGASHTPAYLALNPTGRTPVLVDGDLKLWESNAIMQYVASQKPNALWPNDARARADIGRWQCWQLAHWGAEGCEPLIFERLVKKFLNMGPPDAAAVAKGTESFNKEARVLDAHLPSNRSWSGKSRRSPISRSRRRCSTPRKPNCRSRPTRESRIGSAACRRCPHGATLRHRRPLPPPDA